MKQSILSMTTTGPNLRSSAEAWDCEDGDLIRQDKEIGLSSSPMTFYCYKTPMHAIGAGWQLMAPPKLEPVTIDGKVIELWEWWFQRTDKWYD